MYINTIKFSTQHSIYNIYKFFIDTNVILHNLYIYFFSTYIKNLFTSRLRKILSLYFLTAYIYKLNQKTIKGYLHYFTSFVLGYWTPILSNYLA